MLEENVKTVRDQIDALSRGDLDRWLDGFDPDVEFRLPPEWPDERVGKGREAALASMKSALDLVARLEIHVREIIELEDPDRLLSAPTLRQPVREAGRLLSSTAST